MAKFNFLNHRTASQKAEADLRQRFPTRSVFWIKTKARQIAQVEDVTAELRAPEPTRTRKEPT